MLLYDILYGQCYFYHSLSPLGEIMHEQQLLFEGYIITEILNNPENIKHMEEMDKIGYISKENSIQKVFQEAQEALEKQASKIKKIKEEEEAIKKMSFDDIKGKLETVEVVD